MSEVQRATVSVESKRTVKIAVIYDSHSGSTKRVAENVAQGVSSVQGAEVDLLTAEEATAKGAEIAHYDGFIWGSATLFGGVSAKLKLFFESTGQMFNARKLQDKIAGGFTNSASQAGDKQGALLQLFTFASQQGMLWVPLGIAPINNKTDRNEEAYNRGGHFAGLGTQSYVDDPTLPPEADLRSARFYGERIARIALQYYK